MIRLAKSARSENVRQLAAADLMDRAGLARKPWSASAGESAGAGKLEININLSGADERVVIEHQLEE